MFVEQPLALSESAKMFGRGQHGLKPLYEHSAAWLAKLLCYELEYIGMQFFKKIIGFGFFINALFSRKMLNTYFN